MKCAAPFLIIVLVAVLGAVGGKLLVQADSRAGKSQAGGLASNVTGPEKLAHVRGPENASVTLEEFGDFQCPACAETASVIRQVENAYGDRLRLVFWEFPLAMHQYAQKAARVAEAAGVQGQFWEMHDLLYKHQPSWSHSADVSADFQQFALELHLNMTRFQGAVGSADTAGRVHAQRDYGVSRGVKNTPTLFINGREFLPPFTSERLHEAIDSALTGKDKASHG